MKCNPYCDALGIGIPQLEVAKDHRDANYYGLLIVVLLERGEPVTLQQAAARFEEAGVAPAAQALASLKRCKPARAPIYRDGDRYALDPHDEQTDLWAFRLGHARSTDPGGRSRSRRVCWCRARAASVARSATKRRWENTSPPAN